MQQKSIKELAKEKNDIKVVLFFDITLNVKNNITGETLGTLSTLDNKIKFNMALPEELTKVAEGYTRKYYVVRYHDGKSEIFLHQLMETYYHLNQINSLHMP